jgi:hypothetical protein
LKKKINEEAGARTSTPRRFNLTKTFWNDLSRVCDRFLGSREWIRRQGRLGVIFERLNFQAFGPTTRARLARMKLDELEANLPDRKLFEAEAAHIFE